MSVVKPEEYLKIPQKVRSWLNEIGSIDGLELMEDVRKLEGRLKNNHMEIAEFLSDVCVELYREHVIITFSYYNTTYKYILKI